MNPDLMSKTAPVRHSCPCARCGRTLKNPKWVAVGYGKVCYANIQAERQLVSGKKVVTI